MSEPSGVVPQIETADTEIELSNQDLLALSDAPSIEPCQTGRTLEQPGSASSGSARNKAPPTSASRPFRLSLSLAVAVGVVGVTYLLTTSERTSSSPANTSQQVAAHVEQPAQTQLAKSEPVRFTNPFDTKEVFEFPPGTTESQAREAVAELLMERALSRQQT